MSVFYFDFQRDMYSSLNFNVKDFIFGFEIKSRFSVSCVFPQLSNILLIFLVHLVLFDTDKLYIFGI